MFDVLINPAKALIAHEKLKSTGRFIPGRDMRDGLCAGDCENLDDKIVRIQSLVKEGGTITKAETRRMIRSPCEDSFSETMAKLIFRRILVPEKNKFIRPLIKVNIESTNSNHQFT